MTATLSARLTAAYRTHRHARMVRQLTRRLGLPYVGREYRGPVARKLAKVAA